MPVCPVDQTNRIGTFGWNLVTNTNTWSSELKAMYGMRDTPSVAEWTQLIHPMDLPRVNQALRIAMQTGVYSVQFRAKQLHGSVHVIQACGSVIYSPSGIPLALVGLNADLGWISN